jgi:uncharacterized protein YutE (UPF0331/DUF86 family)
MTLSEAEVERIVTAVETSEESLAVLADKQALSRAEYLADRETRDVVERRFVKLTEATLDIATTVLRHEHGSQPESNPASMIALGEAGALTEATAREMAEAARFRNVLAHTYGDAIDHDEVYDALQDLDRYHDFLVAIRSHLRTLGALD